MTSRLYYDDSLLTSFDATVTTVRHINGRPAVVLDRTAFYPTSGGQPFDVGTLGVARVVEVLDDEASGEILHVVDVADTFAPGGRVTGRVDWTRRLDHMQQHTGQHILSAAFEQACGARTVSFHLGADAATIDLDRDVSAAGIEDAERRANDVVWEDRAVTIRYATSAEAALLPLRKESRRDGTLRLVEVPDCDLSACGGTHVSRTGMIGVIAIIGTERFKGGVRVSFVCGKRALVRLHALQTAVDASVRRLSVLPADLPAAIGRMQDESKSLKHTIRSQQAALAKGSAGALRETAEIAGGTALVIAHVSGWDATGVKLLASQLTASPGVVVALAGDGTPTPIVVARSNDGRIDAAEALSRVVAEFGGKGGGKAAMAQGAVSAEPAPLLAAFRTVLLKALD